ncbi:uncharacterized protein LOC130675717 [Microplitis mediator]|uniref:uncharacterized protein LOC130675717 n=1 Tax=Microplitis mediator TaxID=375433 RepID=UPI002556E653|nr:uncharacterized protein LOC130675717 [Microplitis mediator]
MKPDLFILKGWKDGVSNSAGFGVSGNNVKFNGKSLKLDLFTEDDTAMLNFIRHSIEVATPPSTQPPTPAIFVYGRTGSGKTTTLFGDEGRTLGLLHFFYGYLNNPEVVFKAEECSESNFRDMVKTRNVRMGCSKFIPVAELEAAPISKLKSRISNRLKEENGVHSSPSRGIVLLELTNTRTHRKCVVIDMPGLEGREVDASRPSGSPSTPASKTTRWITSISSGFHQYINRPSSITPVHPLWSSINDALPVNTLRFLVASIKPPYNTANIASTMELLWSFKSQRTFLAVPGVAVSPASGSNESALIIQLRAELAAARNEIQELRAERDALREQIATHRCVDSSSTQQPPLPPEGTPPRYSRPSSSSASQANTPPRQSRPSSSSPSQANTPPRHSRPSSSSSSQANTPPRLPSPALRPSTPSPQPGPSSQAIINSPEPSPPVTRSKRRRVSDHPLTLPTAIELRPRYAKPPIVRQDATDDEKAQAMIHALGLDNIADVPMLGPSAKELYAVDDPQLFKRVDWSQYIRLQNESGTRFECVKCGMDLKRCYAVLHTWTIELRQSLRCPENGCAFTFRYPCDIPGHLKTVHSIELQRGRKRKRR